MSFSIFVLVIYIDVLNSCSFRLRVKLPAFVLIRREPDFLDLIPSMPPTPDNLSEATIGEEHFQMGLAGGGRVGIYSVCPEVSSDVT